MVLARLASVKSFSFLLYSTFCFFLIMDLACVLFCDLYALPQKPEMNGEQLEDKQKNHPVHDFFSK